MSDIVQADIFFFVSTLALIVVTIAVIVLIYYMVKVIQEVRTVIRAIQHEISNLVLKRHNMEVKTLTFQKVLKAFGRGELFRNSDRHRIEEKH